MNNQRFYGIIAAGLMLYTTNASAAETIVPVTVDGGVTGNTIIGNNAAGSITIDGGTTRTKDDIRLGTGGAGDGTLTITGGSSMLTVTDEIFSLSNTKGTLKVLDRGNITFVPGMADDTAQALGLRLEGSTTTGLVDGAGSVIHYTSPADKSDFDNFVKYLWTRSNALLRVQNGGKITGNPLEIFMDGDSSIEVDGAGSMIDLDVHWVSNFRDSSLTITNGGQVKVKRGGQFALRGDTDSTHIINGAGSRLDLTSTSPRDDWRIGNGGRNGTMRIEDGGVATTNGGIEISRGGGAVGTVVVTGTDSRLEVARRMIFNPQNNLATGILEVNRGGVVTVDHVTGRSAAIFRPGLTATSMGGPVPWQIANQLDLTTGLGNDPDYKIDLEVELLDGFIPNMGDLFTIATMGSIIGTFDGLADGASLMDTGSMVTFTIDYQPNAIVLEVTQAPSGMVVPEPSTYLLLLGGFVLARCRRAAV